MQPERKTNRKAQKHKKHKPKTATQTYKKRQIGKQTESQKREEGKRQRTELTFNIRRQLKTVYYC